MAIFVVIAAICIALFFIQRQFHEKAIYKKIESIGGKVIKFERHYTTSGSLLWFVGKGETLYKVCYSLDGIEQVEWVKFGWLARWKL